MLLLPPMEDCEQLDGFVRASLLFFPFARYFSRQMFNANLMLVQCHSIDLTIFRFCWAIIIIPWATYILAKFS